MRCGILTNFSSNCNVMIGRMAFAVAFVFFSLAVCVLGRSLTETSPDTAIALEDNRALAERSRIAWSNFTPSLGREQLRIPHLHFRALTPFTQQRRSLRKVHTAPHEMGHHEGGGGGGLSTAGIVIIVVSCVSFVVLVAVLVFWCRRKKNNDADWRFVDAFKRKKPATDEEKLYNQAKTDTHLSGY